MGGLVNGCDEIRSARPGFLNDKQFVFVIAGVAERSLAVRIIRAPRPIAEEPRGDVEKEQSNARFYAGLGVPTLH